MPRRSLPRIEIDITVPVPCRVDWNGMTRIDPRGLVRFCDSCDKPVYDSRSMTRAQLHAVIARHEGNPRCLRLHVRPDGTIVTRDCFAPILRLGRALWLKTSLLALAFWGALFGLRRLPGRPQLEEAAVLEPRDTQVVQGFAGLTRRPAPPSPRPPDPERERLLQLLSPPPGGEGPTPSGLGLLDPIDRAAPLRDLDTTAD